MKRISLTQNQFALVDDSDFEELNQYKWYAHKDRSGVYCAVRNITVDKGQRTEQMHRRILGLQPGDGRDTDHINGNTLNNRRYNLRIATRGQNRANSKACCDSSSKYKGIDWCKRNKKWRVRICISGKHIHLGLFSNEGLAARMYDIAARHFFGEFAKCNFEPMLPPIPKNWYHKMKRAHQAGRADYS